MERGGRRGGGQRPYKSHERGMTGRFEWATAYEANARWLCLYLYLYLYLIDAQRTKNSRWLAISDHGVRAEAGRGHGRQ